MNRNVRKGENQKMCPFLTVNLGENLSNPISEKLIELIIINCAWTKISWKWVWWRWRSFAYFRAFNLLWAFQLNKLKLAVAFLMKLSAIPLLKHLQSNKSCCTQDISYQTEIAKSNWISAVLKLIRAVEL